MGIVEPVQYGTFRDTYRAVAEPSEWPRLTPNHPEQIRSGISHATYFFGIVFVVKLSAFLFRRHWQHLPGIQHKFHLVG